MRWRIFVLMLIPSAFIHGETTTGEFAGQPPLETVHVTGPMGGARAPHLLVRQQSFLDSQKRLVDPRYAGRTNDPAMIPGGQGESLYREPYAYGYFGARAPRRWTQHFGYLRQYNQWTQR